jgi:hypothetical protein
MKQTPEERIADARSEIARATADVNYHDRMASEARKRRQKAQAKLDRAIKASAKQDAWAIPCA